MGTWWTIPMVLGYLMLFFFLETRILCSHCPYYSEDSTILHCLANHGFIKFFRYHPEPLTEFEKNLLRIGFILFGTLPLLAQMVNLAKMILSLTSYDVYQFGIILCGFVISIIGVIWSFSRLTTQVCPNCVNFSCPFNKVPEDIVERFLDRNPIMKKAWN